MNVFRLLLLLFIALLLGMISSPSHAQQFDFEKYPKLNFSFNQLDLDLTIDPDSRNIKGTARYEIQANIEDVDSLVLQAAHMEISTVLVNDENTEFNLHNDSLIIKLPDSSETGQRYNVSVDYSTIAKFGILKNDQATVWTSLLPRSHLHWLPGIDHPRVTFHSNITIRIPSGYQAVANGVKIKEEVVDVEQVRYIYKTRNQVPATSLAFAIGQFDRDETSFGIKKVNLSSEKGLLKESERSDLLEKASQVLEEAEQQLGTEFPFERLNLVVLQDHFWETKSWGASTVFIYKNRGDLINQLRRGIYGQWFGVFHREEQWSDAEATNLLQTALHFQITDEPAELAMEDHPGKDVTTVYDAFGPEVWNRFQHRFDDLDANLKKTVIQSFSDLLSRGEGVYNFRDYGELWYRRNGQPFFDLKFDEQETADSTEPDSVVYRVDYAQSGSDLRLTFTAKKGAYDELVTLPLVQISSEGVDTLEVTFTGVQDSVNIRVPAFIENVNILSSKMPNLILDEYKPASFLIYQLRNATSVDERVEAANKLGYHSDNPDLQLAIKDFMNQELHPKVKSALLRSFGKITAGASGTGQVFLDALQSDNKEIQEAGLSVLQNYAGNEHIQESVRQYALQADSLPNFRKATLVLSVVADSTVFGDFVSSIVKTDTAGFKAIFAIQELANAGKPDKAVRQAEFYISDVYDYPVRSAALHILLQHDHAPADWETRVEELLEDVDPRIRFLMVKGLPKIEGLVYADMLETIVQDEYDERVFRAMQEVMSIE